MSAAGDHIENAGHCTAHRWIELHGARSSLFAVIRNPYDRVVSEYFFRRRRYDQGERNPHLDNLSLSFNEWVIDTYVNGSYCTLQFFEGTDIPYNSTNMINGRLIWFIPQTEWIHHPTTGLVLTEHILRFENLSADWRSFANQFKGMPRSLAFINQSRNDNNYRKHYSSESKEVIERLFQSDLEAFNYSF